MIAYMLSMTSLTNQCSVSISQLFTWLSHPLLYISHILSHLTFSVVYKEPIYSSIPQLQSLRISTIIGSCLSHWQSTLILLLAFLQWPCHPDSVALTPS